MSGFGDRLRREREMRGVSLEEIAESTKIGTRSLRALEQEDFEKLPGGIFNKGFVRAYSHFIGIDEDQALADFEAAWKEYQNAKHPPVQIGLEAQIEETGTPRGGLFTVAVLLLLAVTIAAYAYKHYGDGKSAPQQPIVDKSRQTVQPELTLAAPATSVTAPSASQSQRETSTKIANPPVHNRVTSPADSLAQRSSIEKSERPSSESAAAASTLGAPIHLEVFAREDSWLSVLADGKRLGEGVLAAQKSRTIRANREVKLRLGNVAGVEVSFNGKPVIIDGAPRQVKELTFTPEGLRQ